MANANAVVAEDPAAWVGRTERREDVVTAAPLIALSALLDRDDPRPRPGDPAPPLAHWLYFLPTYRQSEAAPDGHLAHVYRRVNALLARLRRSLEAQGIESAVP